MTADPRSRSRVLLDGPGRAAARAQLKGVGLRRRGSAASHRGRGQHLDRDDALQLSPAPPRRAGEGRGEGRGRNAYGVQHRGDIGRHHHGHRGHAVLAGQPRGDRRLDRARRARAHVRRAGHDVGLRQDDSRLRDGPRPAFRRARPDALRRLDRPRPLAGQGRDHPGGLRGHRRARRRRPVGRGPARPREPRQPRRRRLRRPVHGQHDGDGFRGPGDLTRGQLHGAGRGRQEGSGGRGLRASGGGDARTRHHPGTGDHARVARERDRGRRDVRRLHQPRAAPARRGPRGRSRAGARGLRPDRLGHAAPVRPEARRPLRGHRPLPRRRGAAA